MEGYHNRPEETASVLKDGWLLTGDMAKMDDEGYITITGRKKEMIIVGGLNVFPAEIEALLDEHPGVAHCAVMGVSDERHGEQIRAYVVPKQLPEGAQGDGNLPADAVPGLEQQIREHLKERLPGYKMPRQYVFRAQLPLGPTGKVLKRALVE
jgi:long-chain acyl-CoA synthetase